MARKVRENQLYEGKSWHGFTPKEHLINVFQEDPYLISDKIEQILDINLGMDFVSFMSKFGTHTVPKERYQWALQGAVDRNYALVAAWEDRAGTVAIGTNNPKIGANRTFFYMDYTEDAFAHTEVIVGHKPDLYKIYVEESGFKVGNVFRYKVTIISNSSEDFIPVEELAANTRWSAEYGLVTDTLSDRGFDISFQSPAMIEAEMSMFRMQHVVPGNMVREGKIVPLKFHFQGADGSVRSSWISNVEYEFLRKARKTRAALTMYGKSNRWSDGTYGNYDKNGYTIKAGSGFKEQWQSSNKHTFSLEPDLDFLTEIALDATVGKVKPENRKMVISSGEWGYMGLHKMIQRKLGSSAIKDLSYLQDSTGRAYKWMGNDISLNLGQFKSVAIINGIEFMFMIDPFKDDNVRNKIRHPLGGLASSYEYDIFGFGSRDEKSNMQVVKLEGEEPIYGIVRGMRSAWGDTGGSSMSNPKSIATPIDGSTLHYQDYVGSIVWDPTKVIQYHPEILY